MSAVNEAERDLEHCSIAQRQKITKDKKIESAFKIRIFSTVFLRFSAKRCSGREKIGKLLFRRRYNLHFRYCHFGLCASWTWYFFKFAKNNEFLVFLKKRRDSEKENRPVENANATMRSVESQDFEAYQPEEQNEPKSSQSGIITLFTVRTDQKSISRKCSKTFFSVQYFEQF